MPKKDEDGFTKERILKEAESLFAQKGYHAVSIREITAAANCNLAAVNYHFGNKKTLYLEVFRSRWIPRAKRIEKYFKKSLAAQSSLSPSALAQVLSEAFLIGPLTDEERKRHHQLMIREMCNPTEALDLLSDQVIQPFFKDFTHKLRSVMPENTTEECLKLDCLTMFSMVIYFNFARSAVTMITGREYDPAFKARLVEHIAEFSLKGLSGCKK